MSALAALCSEYHAREPGEAEAAAQGEWVSALSPAPSGAGRWVVVGCLPLLLQCGRAWRVELVGVRP